MSNVVVVLGKPNAGKGTRLKHFLTDERAHKYVHLSTGDVLRKARKEKTELGKMAAKYMDAGELIPDDIINGIVLEALNETDKVVLLDGFPRTVEQAKVMLSFGVVPDAIIYLDIDDEVIINRAKNRLMCESCNTTYTLDGYKPPKVAGICDCCGDKLIKRKDDSEEVVRARLNSYKLQTLPVLSTLLKADIPLVTITEEGDCADKKFAEAMESL